MSFQYSSSSNGFLSGHGDRLPQGRLRWAESRECSSSTESRRSGQFRGLLKINQEENTSSDGTSADFSGQNSVVEQGARCADCPASPSPVCSPVATTPALSSHKIDGSRSVRCRNREFADSSTEGSIVLYNGDQSRGKEAMETSAGVAGAGPYSSVRSDNGLFGVLAANLHSNRESKPISENPEEENDGVRDIHVTVEQSRTAAASNETRRSAQRRQHNWSDTSIGSFVSSDSESISLSREFNNVLAAAAAAGSNSSAQALDSNRAINILNETSSVRSPTRRTTRLPGIGEEEPTRSTGEDAGDRNEGDGNYINHNRMDNMALIPTSPTAAEGNRDQRNAGRDYFALVPVDGNPESTGSASDRDAPTSSWDTQHNEGAIVESGHTNGDHIDSRGSRSSSHSASCNETRLPTTKQLALQKEVALQKVKRDEIEAKAIAWEDAKMAKVDNRFKREEAIIEAWENEQKVKASIKMKKVERKLEEKRATAFEKMQNEIAIAHRKAENRRAVAEARRGAAKAKIVEVTDKIRSLGKLPKKCLCF